MKIDVKLEEEDLKLLARMQAVCNSLKCHECPLFETLCGKNLYEWKLDELEKNKSTED